MKTAYDIIIKPVITEQSMEQTEAKKYVFQVAIDANKSEIKKAIEQIFGVKVEKVNTIRMDGKAKRQGVKVENLDYSVQGNTVKLTWQIPDNIPDEFLRPLEVSIQKVENDIYRDVITIGNEGTFAEGIAIDANKRYRFVVKLVGNLTDEVVETGISSRIYSEGQVIDIQ